jgi:ADP-ribose pyrophosphatase
MKPWTRIEPTATKKVGYRTVVTKTFVDNHNQQHTFDLFGGEAFEAAAVIAITEDNQVIVARQFRTGPEKVMDELPGGGLERGEDRLATMKRELLEETGYETGAIEYLGEHHKDAYMNGSWHYFFATGCRRATRQSLDFEEDIEVHLIPISQLFDNARYDKMTDPMAVLLAYEKLKKLQENAA